MEKINATVIRNRGKSEVRCGNCGKLLLICKFIEKNAENSEKPLDKSAQSAIIVVRCTRNDCKSDNLFLL